MASPQPTTKGESTTLTPPPELKALVEQALSQAATDIHIDAKEEGYTIRFRVDGRVQPIDDLTIDQGETLINQIQVAAELGIERSVEPTEGRVTWSSDERDHGIRVSIMPTLGRLAAHLRLLNPPSEILKPEELGLADYDLKAVKKVLGRNEGLIVIAGPTGAGKTTTLYSLVSLLDLQGSIGVSIEDPVEYDLPYVRQVQVDPDHGMDMQQGLVTLLRMDPDLILVGEARDRDSTHTAAQAAASGHFVFTTLHANGPHMVVAALRFLGVPDHLLGSTLRLVVVQDLVRRLCTSCAKSRDLHDAEKELFEEAGLDAPDQIKEPAGCEDCRDYGYHGRVGVFQVTPILEELGLAIAAGRDPHELQQIVRDMGIHSLFYDALLKVAAGTTSMQEVLPLYQGNHDIDQLLA